MPCLQRLFLVKATLLSFFHSFIPLFWRSLPEELRGGLQDKLWILSPLAAFMKLFPQWGGAEQSMGPEAGCSSLHLSSWLQWIKMPKCKACVFCGVPSVTLQVTTSRKKSRYRIEKTHNIFCHFSSWSVNMIICQSSCSQRCQRRCIWACFEVAALDTAWQIAEAARGSVQATLPVIYSASPMVCITQAESCAAIATQ